VVKLTLLYPVIGATLFTLVAVSVFRRDSPTLAMITSLAFTVLLLLFVLPGVGQMVRLLEELSSRAGVRSGYLAVLWKAVAISYLTAFAAELSRDAGEKTIASGVELVGKVMVLVTALPVVVAILNQLVELLP
jgi:stage III sporulation protein AD